MSSSNDGDEVRQVGGAATGKGDQSGAGAATPGEVEGGPAGGAGLTTRGSTAPGGDMGAGTAGPGPSAEAGGAATRGDLPPMATGRTADPPAGGRGLHTGDPLGASSGHDRTMTTDDADSRPGDS